MLKPLTAGRYNTFTTVADQDRRPRDRGALCEAVLRSSTELELRARLCLLDLGHDQR